MLCTVLRENTLPDTQQKNAIILCVEDTADFTVCIHSFHRVMRTTLNALICSHARKTTKCSFFPKLKFIVFLSIYIEFFSYFPFDSRRFFPHLFFYEGFMKPNSNLKTQPSSCVSTTFLRSIYFRATSCHFHGLSTVQAHCPRYTG